MTPWQLAFEPSLDMPLASSRNRIRYRTGSNCEHLASSAVFVLVFTFFCYLSCPSIQSSLSYYLVDSVLRLFPTGVCSPATGSSENVSVLSQTPSAVVLQPQGMHADQPLNLIQHRKSASTAAIGVFRFIEGRQRTGACWFCLNEPSMFERSCHVVRVLQTPF